MTKTCWTYEEILRELRGLMAESFAVEVGEIQPQTNFYHDLGGDSIEELNLSFQCERTFGLRRGPFRALLELADGQPQTDDDGFIRAPLTRIIHDGVADRQLV